MSKPKVIWTDGYSISWDCDCGQDNKDHEIDDLIQDPELCGFISTVQECEHCGRLFRLKVDVEINIDFILTTAKISEIK